MWLWTSAGSSPPSAFATGSPTCPTARGGFGRLVLAEPPKPNAKRDPDAPDEKSNKMRRATAAALRQYKSQTSRVGADTANIRPIIHQYSALNPKLRQHRAFQHTQS